LLGEIYTTARFYKDDDVTITAYKGKTNKNILFLIYLHTNVSIAKNEKRKPDPVAF